MSFWILLIFSISTSLNYQFEVIWSIITHVNCMTFVERTFYLHQIIFCRICSRIIWAYSRHTWKHSVDPRSPWKSVGLLCQHLCHCYVNRNKAKRSAKQQRSDLVIVFLVQCSQCSVDQTGHPQKRRSCREEYPVNLFFWKVPIQ